MKLCVKDVGLSTGGPLIAVLHAETAKKLNLYPTDRIIIKRLRVPKQVNCVLDISTKGIKVGEIGMFAEVLDKLDVSVGTHVEVEIADRPISIDYIKKKLEGHELEKLELETLVKEIVKNKFSNSELTYFVSACYSQGLSMREITHLTNAIVENGERLKFKDKIILDKHSIGGVPGNRTTLVVVPLLASLGYKIPKTSSRAITSAAGTADCMEVLAPVDLSLAKIKKVVNSTGACIAWGGAINLAGADDKLIKIRHPLSIDPPGMLVASILAKKKASGATHVLIDIPYGSGAKVSNKKDAQQLKKHFVKVGRLLNLKTKVILTDGSHPIGNGIGPSLEASDVISVLKGGGPNDLREKCIKMATEMLKLAGEWNTRATITKELECGNAYKKFKEIIYAQGGRKHLHVPKAKFYYNFKAKRDGKVKSMNNKDIANIARLAGAPDDKVAGLYIRVDINEDVKRGMTLFTVYSNSEKDIETVKKRLKSMNPIVY